MSEIQKWAIQNGYERPFNALIEMSPEARENLRLSMNFEWKDKSRTNPDIEAKELIDADIKGIVARLHTQLEMFNPFAKNLNWREILQRILDTHIQIIYPAHSSEVEMEKILVDYLMQKKGIKLKNDKELNIPTAALSKIGKNTGLIAMIINDLGKTLDSVLGSQDAPAINAVFSICLFLHKDALG